MKKILLLIALTLCLNACQRDNAAPEKKPVEPPSPAATTAAVNPASPAKLTIQPSASSPTRPMPGATGAPILVETAAEALPIWRQYAPERPTLVLLASTAGLLPYPEELKGAILELARSAEQPQLRKAAIASVANPILLPEMALSAALDAGFFSRVIWMIPLKPETTLTLEQFRAKLLAQGVLTAKEAADFRAVEGNFVGTVRNIPLLATTTTTIPLQKGPVLLHFDLNYLRAGYHNEIRKQLHLHVRETLQRLRDSHLQVLATTIALSNLTGELPLQTRFLAGMVRNYLAHPQQLDQAVSSHDGLRADAMYLGNFFRKEEVLVKYQALEKTAQRDPSVKYDLYQVLRQFDRIAEAQEKLAQAVALDPVYALEYLTLAELALEKQRPDGALQMYEKAAAIFPENPFIPILKARIYLQIGHPEKVQEILAPVQAVTWSNVYYPQMKTEIDGLLAAAKNQGK